MSKKYDDSTVEDLVQDSENFVMKIRGEWLVATAFEFYVSKGAAMEALAVADGFGSFSEFKRQVAERDLEESVSDTAWRSREAG